jgi:hypothetical protein
MNTITLDGKEWLICYIIGGGYYLVADAAATLPAQTYLIYYNP